MLWCAQSLIKCFNRSRVSYLSQCLRTCNTNQQHLILQKRQQRIGCRPLSAFRWQHMPQFELQISYLLEEIAALCYFLSSDLSQCRMTIQRFEPLLLHPFTSVINGVSICIPLSHQTRKSILSRRESSSFASDACCKSLKISA